MTVTRAIPNKTPIVFVCGAALVATLLGAAYFLRGPDSALAPNIETKSVVMQDGHTLNVQTREVTIDQWQACYDAGSCTLDLSKHKKDTDYPATGLNHVDAMQYIGWLNTVSDVHWRLPTSTEWYELATNVMPERPNPIFTDPSLTWASTYLTDAKRTGRALRPSGAFTTTDAGIEDLDGNVWEWTKDCYAGSSGQGEGLSDDRCPAFIMGGEHEAVIPFLVRDPARGGCAVGAPPAHLGMRVVSEDA